MNYKVLLSILLVLPALVFPLSLYNYQGSGHVADSSQDSYVLSVDVLGTSIEEVKFSIKLGADPWSAWNGYQYNIDDTYYYEIPRSDWINYVGYSIYFKVYAKDSSSQYTSGIKTAGMLYDDDIHKPAFSGWSFPLKQIYNKDIVVDVDITDESVLASAVLHYDYGEDGIEDGTDSTPAISGTTHTFTIPAPGPDYEKRYVSFWVEATDADADRPGDSLYAKSWTMRTKMTGMPKEVYQDVDADGTNEIARNNDNNMTNGYETYQDPNHNTVAMIVDGDGDGMTDYLIDTNADSVYDIYWDPDSDELYSVYTLTVNVEDTAGAAITGAAVSITGTVDKSGSTGTDGKVIFEYLPAGTYDVSASAAGYSSSSQNIVLNSTQEITLTLTASTPPAGGGGGGGCRATTDVDVQETFSAKSGDVLIIPVTINLTGTCPYEDYIIEVDTPDGWATDSKEIRVMDDETGTVEMTVNIPADAEGSYGMTLHVNDIARAITVSVEKPAVAEATKPKPSEEAVTPTEEQPKEGEGEPTPTEGETEPATTEKAEERPQTVTGFMTAFAVQNPAISTVILLILLLILFVLFKKSQSSKSRKVKRKPRRKRR